MTTFFDEGTMDFSYTGSLTGGFSADGSVTDVSEFPVDAAGVCVGYYITSEIPGAEGAVFQGYGGVVNPDNTMDIVLVWINREGESALSTETYPIDAEETVIITFYDDADEVQVFPFSPPVVTSAAHFFTSQPGGNLTFDAVSHTGVSGTYSCTMVDALNPTLTITVTDAMFNLTGTGTPAKDKAWGDVKALYR